MRLAPGRTCLALVLISSLLIPGVVTAGSRLGLYVDETGSTCSFSGNSSGIVTAYLVVKADVYGVQGLRFAAPVPACFDGVFLFDSAPAGVNVIGSSPTGVSVAFQSCVIPDAPAVALQISYLANGGTAPCCEFPVVPDPFVGAIEVIDCSLVSRSATPVTAHFNADASCPCVDGSGTPPHAPTTPAPANLATNVGARPVMTWVPYAGDQAYSFDVYLGPNTSPAKVATVTQPSYQPVVPLNPATQYYWRVVVRNADALETSGPEWRFTTATNGAPLAPTLTSPPDEAGNFPNNNITLQWSGTDPNGDALTYDVYLGVNGGTPVLYAPGVTVPYYTIPLLDYGKWYRWKVVARDQWGASASSATWDFRTAPDVAPSAPLAVFPLSGAIRLSLDVTLQWSATDDNGDALAYDLYFGADPPPLLAAGLTSDDYTLPALAFETTYWWKVVARDPSGHETAGDVWSFTTKLLNEPPSQVQWASPPDNGVASPNVTLQWTVTDLEGDALTYDVYLGTEENPPLVAEGLEVPEYTPAVLAISTLYRWTVVSHDSFGNTTSNPVYEFSTTASNAPNPPSNPSPPDLATDLSTSVDLSWECSDPDGDPVTYTLYFGAPGAAIPIASGLTTPTCTVGGLSRSSVYNWSVRARDSHGVETQGATWQFTTRALATPVLTSWAPIDGATNLSPAITLMWSGYSPDYAAMTYDVYFGETADPPLVAAGQVSTLYVPGPLATGTTYHWKVVPRDSAGPGVPGPVLGFTTAGVTTGVDDRPPVAVTLGRNHPNPFNPQTIIPYGIPVGPRVNVRIAIYDAAGKRVRRLMDGSVAQGWHEVAWMGDNDRGETVSSGVYYCVLRVNNERHTQKLVLLK